MMNSNKACPLSDNCGGCPRRNLSLAEYRSQKIDAVKNILAGINQPQINFGEPVFIGDGTRRRAVMAFRCKKGQLTLGFNAARSDEVLDCPDCLLLAPEIRKALPKLRELLSALCNEPYTIKKKGKKPQTVCLSAGDVSITSAANGLDIVLEITEAPELNHRMSIFEAVSAAEEIVRVSWRRRPDEEPEPIVEKAKPVIKIAGREVYIPAGTFLQPSLEGETALLALVLKYLGGTRGKIADLFCGVGTFSYPLSALPDTKILAVDSSVSLLNGFRRSVNKNMIPNIEIIAKNLFKYPLDAAELTGLKAVVFDPPRAGAEAQVKQLAALPESGRPEKIIAVSCNPHSFVRDANILLSGGYQLQEVTIVDQFVYSNHSELVALFTKQS